jgi:nucleoside-diphosphate-sugar epimerase
LNHDVIVFGATGMVGTEALQQCLESDNIKSVLAIGRHTSGIEHRKLKEIEHDNFLDFSSLEQQMSNADVCFYCLGVYQGKVSKKQFWEITVDYLDALVSSLERCSKDITFCLFSAQGADPVGKVPFLFSKAKGRAEDRLLKSEIHKNYIFRPGFINPGRKSPQFMASMWIFKFIYKFFPSIGIDASQLAKVMIHTGLYGHEKKILENRDLRIAANST